MSVLPKETVQVLAELAGVPALEDRVATALVADVEFRLREVIQESIKFMRHSRRNVLTTEHVNEALRVRNVEPLYGHGGGTKSVVFKRAAGGGELYVGLCNIPEFLWIYHGEYYLDDKEIPLNEVFAKPLPKCPLDTTFCAHWLAIEGVQPATKHNPAPKDEVLSVGKKRKDKSAQVKDLVKHALSQELQIYYDKITTAVLGDSEEYRDAALKSLAADPGIHQLVPYFTQFIFDTVRHHVRNLPTLKRAMRMVAALLESEHIHLELYLHQLMSSILTCIVGRWLCKTPDEDHWSLRLWWLLCCSLAHRDLAADIAAKVCERFGFAYATLQPRVTKTLLHAFLDVMKPLTTQYGAIVGLSKLGPNVTQVLILPNLEAYVRLLQTALDSDDEIRRMEAQKCYDALLEACGRFLRHTIESGKELVSKMQVEGEKTSTSSDAPQEDVSSVLELALPGAEEYYRLLTTTFGDGLAPYIGGRCGASLGELLL